MASETKRSLPHAIISGIGGVLRFVSSLLFSFPFSSFPQTKFLEQHNPLTLPALDLRSSNARRDGFEPPRTVPSVEGTSSSWHERTARLRIRSLLRRPEVRLVDVQFSERWMIQLVGTEGREGTGRGRRVGGLEFDFHSLSFDSIPTCVGLTTRTPRSIFFFAFSLYDVLHLVFDLVWCLTTNTFLPPSRFLAIRSLLWTLLHAALRLHANKRHLYMCLAQEERRRE